VNCRDGGRSNDGLYAVSFENLRGSQVLGSRLVLECDVGSQGLTLVAVMYFGFSATVPKQACLPIAR
jgi:hypothetical protein